MCKFCFNNNFDKQFKTIKNLQVYILVSHIYNSALILRKIYRNIKKFCTVIWKVNTQNWKEYTFFT